MPEKRRLPWSQNQAKQTKSACQSACNQPTLANNPQTGNRYNAACAAALAGCGQGNDADKLDTKERARLRRQALDWLRVDLKAYGQVMDKSEGKAGPAVAQRMQHWLADADFAGVRGSEALAKLPEAERSAWQDLWSQVADTLARAQRATPATKPVSPLRESSSAAAITLSAVPPAAATGVATGFGGAALAGGIGM